MFVAHLAATVTITLLVIVAHRGNVASRAHSVEQESTMRSNKSDIIFVLPLPVMEGLKISAEASRARRSVTEHDEDVILDQLNDKRRVYHAANMLYVKWDPQLESFAAMWSRYCDANTPVSKSSYVNQSLVGAFDPKFMPLATATDSIFSGFANRSQFFYANLYAIGCTRTVCAVFTTQEDKELINITVYACIVGFMSSPEEMIQFGGACTQCPSTHPTCLNGLCAEPEEDYFSSSEFAPPIIGESLENLSTRTLTSVTPFPVHTVKAQSPPSSGPGKQSDPTTRTTLKPTTQRTTVSGLSTAVSCSRSNCATDSTRGSSSSSPSRSTLGIVIGVICGSVLLLVLLVVSTIHVVICTRRKRLEQRRANSSASRSRSSSAPGSASIYSVSQGFGDGPPPPYVLATNYPIPPPPYSEISISYESLAPPYESIELPKYSDLGYVQLGGGVQDIREGSSTSGFHGEGSSTSGFHSGSGGSGSYIDNTRGADNNTGDTYSNAANNSETIRTNSATNRETENTAVPSGNHILLHVHDSSRIDSISRGLGNSTITESTSRGPGSSSTSTESTSRGPGSSTSTESLSRGPGSSRTITDSPGQLHYNAAYNVEYVTDDDSSLQRICTDSESSDISATDLGTNNCAFYDSDTVSVSSSHLQPTVTVHQQSHVSDTACRTQPTVHQRSHVSDTACHTQPTVHQRPHVSDTASTDDNIHANISSQYDNYSADPQNPITPDLRRQSGASCQSWFTTSSVDSDINNVESETTETNVACRASISSVPSETLGVASLSTKT